MKEPNISQHIWSEENLRAYREQIEKDSEHSASRKLFFIGPKGSLRQNDELIGIVVNYTRRGFLTDALLKMLLNYDHPLFRVDCMSEKEPRSGEFRFIRYDLIQSIVENRDSELLKKRYQYIDLSDYTDYADEIEDLLRQ